MKSHVSSGAAAPQRCFLLSGTYITEPVPRAAPLRACGLPDAVFLAISATSAWRDLHLEEKKEGEKGDFQAPLCHPIPRSLTEAESTFSSSTHGAVQRMLVNARAPLTRPCSLSLAQEERSCGHGGHSPGASARGERTDKRPSLSAASKPQL